MNQTDIILTVGSTLIGLLVTLVGYFANRQLQKVDDKITKVDDAFFNLKNDIIELKTIDKSALIKHLDTEVIPNLRSRNLEDNLASIRTEVTILKEYQRNKIGPAVDNLLSINRTVSDQGKKIAEQDSLLYKIYEVTKKIVEQKSR